MNLKAALTRKWGPLPAWAWIAITVAIMVIVTSWRKSKQATGDQPATSWSTNPRQAIPNNHDPMYTFIDQSRVDVSTSQYAPLGGRTRPPSWRGRPPWRHHDRPDTPAEPSAPDAGPEAPDGQWVTLTRFMPGQPSGTPSTVHGVAQMVYGSGRDWRRIWNAPQNADIREERDNNERNLRAGDRLWVPAQPETNGDEDHGPRHRRGPSNGRDNRHDRDRERWNR